MEDIETTNRNLAGIHPNIKQLVKQNRGQISDRGGKYDIGLAWDQNESMRKDRVFELTLSKDGEKHRVFIDLDELLWYTRVM